MPTPKLTIALVSMHTDPFAEPGAGDVGGMNVVVKHAAAALVARGHRVEVFVRRADDTSPEVTRHGEVLLHRLPAGPARAATKTEQEGYVAEFSAGLSAAARRAAKAGHPWQILHSHHWFSGAAGLPVARERAAPHIQSFHSIAARRSGEWGLGEQPEGPGRVPAEAMLARDSDAVIAVSRAEAHTAIEIGAAAVRVHVATPGVDHHVFTPGAEAAGRRPIVLAAARIEPLKGLDLAIETLARIPEGRRPRLVISGAPTQGFEGYDHTLHSLVQDRDLTGDVWFAGPMRRAELAGAMRRAAAVIIPSHSETYGLVALEAAACATPVIAARVGGLVDAVQDGRTGVLLSGRDPQVWAHALLNLLADEPRRRAMGAAGAQYAAAFTWERMAQQWEMIYARTLRRWDKVGRAVRALDVEETFHDE